MSRAAVYLRISIDSTGEEKAVARQREDALALLKRRRWTLHEVYVDNSVSASRREKRRPAYDRMVADYRAGLFSSIVCYDLDRLTRQPAQLEQWIEAAETRGLVVVTLNGEADLGTDAGRLFARVKVAVARSEVERMGARRKRANEQTIASGHPAPGRRPFGWEVDGVTLRESEAAVVREVYDAVLDGRSLRALVRDLNARGVESPQGTPWTAFKLRQLIDRERNYGALVRYGVEQPKSAVQAIVDRDTHEKAQAIIGERAQPGRKPEKHLLSGLATCGTCERSLGAKRLKSRNAADREPYYVCASRINRNEPSDGRTHPTIRARILEERVEEEVVSAFLFGSAQLFPARDAGDLGDLHKRLKSTRDGIARLVEAIENGMREGDVAPRRAALYREEEALLSAIQEAQARLASTRFADIRGDLFAGRNSVKFEDAARVRAGLRENYRALDFDAKRRLIAALLDIRVAPGYGAKRARIRHKVVTSLNDTESAA